MSLPPPWLLPRGISHARLFTTSTRSLHPPRTGEPSRSRPKRAPFAPVILPPSSSSPRKPYMGRDASKPRRHVRPPLLGMDYWSGGRDFEGSKLGAGPSGEGEGEEGGEGGPLRLTDEERNALMASEEDPDNILVGKSLGRAERERSVAFLDVPFLGERDAPVAMSCSPASGIAERTVDDLFALEGVKKARKPVVPEVWMSPRSTEPASQLMDDIVQHGKKHQERAPETLEQRGLSWMGLLSSGRKMRFIGVDLESALQTVYHDTCASVGSRLFVIRAIPLYRLPARPHPPFPDAYEAALRVRCENPCVHVAVVAPKATVSKLAVERNKVKRLIKTALGRVADKEGSWQFISPEIAYFIWPKPEVYETRVEQLVAPLERALKEVKHKLAPRVNFGWAAKSPPIKFRKREIAPPPHPRTSPLHVYRWLNDDERREKRREMGQ